MLADLIILLAVPFLLYPFWGPPAFALAARTTVAWLRGRQPPHRVVPLAMAGLFLLFGPVQVTSEGGNIPAFFPWWLALAGDCLVPAGVELTAASWIPTLVAVPLAWSYLARCQARTPGPLDGGTSP